MLLKLNKLFNSTLPKTLITSFNCITTSQISKNSLPTTMSESKVFRKPRYDGRTKKRQWEERRSDKGEGLDPEAKHPKTEDQIQRNENGEKIKRRKFALLMGYSGVDYYGMQRNPNTKTIEEELFKALLTAKFIDETSYNQVQNMQFQRAARTDKGVSAARQVVSMKLAETLDITKINEQLPETIKVFSSRRVTKGFNSKSQCDSRTYTYILPTVAFAPHDAETTQKEYRLNDETFNKINQVLSLFVGTKNYHNFTSKKKPSDPSASRYMKSFVCEKPFLKNDVEFTVLKVHGQSFMMHQIRKMVGSTIAIVRGLATIEILQSAFTMEKVNVPRAPGLGLVLEYVHYDRYNNRYGKDGVHQVLTWEECEDDVNEFKDKYIYPTIINTELKEESMVYWIKNKLSRHSYNEFDDDEKNCDDENESDDEDTKTSENSVNKAIV